MFVWNIRMLGAKNAVQRTFRLWTWIFPSFGIMALSLVNQAEAVKTYYQAGTGM
jgi:hypothetical protein